MAARDFRLSGRMLGFALLLALASCLVFALVPALQAVRATLLPVLRGTAPRVRWLGLRELLVGSQVALALLILIAAGLMLRTLTNLRAVDPGFDPAHVLVLSVDLSPAGYKGQQVATFYRDLLERLRRLPGIEEASMASALPVIGNDVSVDLSVYRMDEKPADAGHAEQSSVRHVLVGNRYFQTMKTKLVRGRDFGPEESSAGAGVVIVNETAARRLWGGRDPLGRRLRLVETKVPFEVVGVVADTTYGNLREEAVPALYLSHGQYERSFVGALLAAQMTILVRTSGAPFQVLGPVRETVRTMDARLPVFNASTLQDLLASTVGVERQAAALYSGLALIAMALAMFGLYGVLTYMVVASTREIGIRVACGASWDQVCGLVLRRSLLLVLCGVVAGLAVAVPATRIVASQVYGVKTADAATWFGTTVVLVGVALLVSAAPARRAMRIDPVMALRYE